MSGDRYFHSKAQPLRGRATEVLELTVDRGVSSTPSCASSGWDAEIPTIDARIVGREREHPPPCDVVVCLEPSRLVASDRSDVVRRTAPTVRGGSPLGRSSRTR